MSAAPPRRRPQLITSVLVVAVAAMVLWFALSPAPNAPMSSAPSASGARSTAPSPSVPIPEIATREELVGNRVVKRREPNAQPSARSEQTADDLRKALMAVHSGTLAEPTSEEQPPAKGETRDSDARLAKYTRQIMAEYFAPAVEGCYESLLEKAPSARGTLQLEVSILGQQELGAAVVDTALQATESINTPPMLDCVKQSLLRLVFPAPPDGRQGISVSQQLEMSP